MKKYWLYTNLINVTMKRRTEFEKKKKKKKKKKISHCVIRTRARPRDSRRIITP